MKWFEGSVTQAVQEAKRRKAVFVVYVAGNDEDTKKMDTTWSDEEVSKLCQQNNYLGLRLQANSDDCAQFSMIYPVVCVPCTYFIGEGGIPLEVTAGYVDADMFAHKINMVAQMHTAQLESQPQEQPKEKQPSQPEVAKPQEQPSVSKQPEAQPEVSKQAEASGSSDAAPPASEEAIMEDSSLPIEERVEKAKQLLAQKREEKAEKEKEEQKAKEKERREVGQNMTKFKQWKAEREAKELKESMRKEKEEARLAKQRVKDQIARDRAERAAKYQKEKTEREDVQQEAKRAKLAAEAVRAEEHNQARMEFARIQFRLPDGSTVTEKFSSAETLGTARSFITEHLGSTFGSFTMCCNYPKRDFTESDMAKSLLDLQLAPSAAIIVIPGSRSISQSPGSSGGTSGMIWMLLAPFLSLWAFISNFLFGSPASQQGAGPSTQSGESEQSNTPSSSTSESKATSRARPKSSYGVRKRQEGNIRRLTADDEDDDSATWNGNSTQQM